MTGRSIKRAMLLLGAALLLALLSSAKAGRVWATYSEIMGCEERCDVAAAGWPAPYLVDYPGISVANSADLTGALVGEDKFRLAPFLLTTLFWLAVVIAIRLLLRRMRGSPKPPA